jgi:hypothetical protein
VLYLFLLSVFVSRQGQFLKSKFRDLKFFNLILIRILLVLVVKMAILCQITFFIFETANTYFSVFSPPRLLIKTAFILTGPRQTYGLFQQFHLDHIIEIFSKDGEIFSRISFFKPFFSQV